jgi:hypothetical protein
MKSSFCSLIPLLPLFCSCHFQRFNSVQFLCSQTHILAGWHLETWLNSTIHLKWTFLYNHFAQTMQKTKPLFCWGMFTALLHNNGSCSVVACIFIAAGIWSPSRCLAMNFYSDFSIPAFRHHVTICCDFEAKTKRECTTKYVFRKIALRMHNVMCPESNRRICSFCCCTWNQVLYIGFMGFACRSYWKNTITSLCSSCVCWVNILSCVIMCRIRLCQMGWTCLRFSWEAMHITCLKLIK